MGNQLTGIAPSQILPVEHYLQDITAFEYETSLGSTRFFKVAKAKFREGYAVVKVFVIHDPSLPLETYRLQLNEIESRLGQNSNVLPFQKTMLSDKAALLFRLYVKDSLYDRISTRPFLSLIEKKFIAFQLLCALNQCHKLEVYHGDMKSENIMVTSWNWVLLTDFASFKPTYLPEDNPADFSYFFDTSRRRTCYIAPERFVESSWKNTEVGKDAGNIEFPTARDVQKGDLTAAMDIFSAGCVITELFTEGKPPFDLSQLLAYRSGEYAPWDLLLSIDDVYIRDLVKHMMQKDPSQRLSAEEYIAQQTDKAFPDFYPFLKSYLQRFASALIMSADDRVNRVKRDLALIFENLHISEIDLEANGCLVLIISLLTSCLRDLQFEKSKLIALELLVELSKFVCAEIVLDRIIPSLLFMINDSFPLVRAQAIRSITRCVVRIKTVPVSDANIFPEYIMPQISHLTQDNIVAVRVAFAENIAVLSETASRFLEIAQLTTHPVAANAETGSGAVQSNASYDVELQALHEMIQQKVVTLICDTENIVKKTLLQNGITQLCVFFGRQKTSDILLSHMITFLNDKKDWHLRGAFFDAIVGIACYIGWQSSTILKPLLQQGLADTEEHVIHKTLVALQTLAEMELIRKPMKYEFLAEVKVFLVHPDQWIREGAVGVVSAMARTMNIADVHCNIKPAIQPYLKQSVLLVSDKLMLLNNLADPISRPVYDFILRSQHIDRLFDCLQDRQLLRTITRSGYNPNYAELDTTMAQIFRKLQSEGMTIEHENRLFDMKDCMVKLHRARANSENGSGYVSDSTGAINLGSVSGKATRRKHCDLITVGDPKQDVSMISSKKSTGKRKPGLSDSLAVGMNEDWKFMFGSSLDKPLKPPKSKQEPVHSASGVSDVQSDQGENVGSIENISLSSAQQLTQSQPQNVSRMLLESRLSGEKLQRTVARSRDYEARLQAKYAQCKLNLRDFVYHKKALFHYDQETRDLLDNTVSESRPPAGWKPKGVLVAHLHEHRGAVNRVQVNHEHSYFATCSNDGSVKVFDCSRMEGKSVTNRSRMSYNKQEGQIKCLAFCQNSQSIACVADKGDSGSIDVFRVAHSGSKYSVLHTRNLDIREGGMAVDITYYDTGSQNILAYATVHGCIIGWDLRSPAKEVWKLQNDLKHGLITSFDVHPMLNWMCTGSSNGTLVCWDMRFQLPVKTVAHPTNARVRRLIAHPNEQSTVISAVEGNNEISFWDLETGSRKTMLWACTEPPLSRTKSSKHSANGICLAKTDNNTFLLTASSDMRVRYWDLTHSPNSQIVAAGATDFAEIITTTYYKSRLIDGTEVVQEMYGTYRDPGNGMPHKGYDMPPTGHHDIITDVSICQPNQCFMITCSRDGVVKVWK